MTSILPISDGRRSTTGTDHQLDGGRTRCGRSVPDGWEHTAWPSSGTACKTCVRLGGGA